MVALGAYVELLNGDWNKISSSFETYAATLTSRARALATGVQYQLEPFTYIGEIYPPCCQSITNNPAVSSLGNPDRRSDVIRAAQYDKMITLGPLMLFEGYPGLVFENPIFISNVSSLSAFNYPLGTNPACNVSGTAWRQGPRGSGAGIFQAETETKVIKRLFFLPPLSPRRCPSATTLRRRRSGGAPARAS